MTVLELPTLDYSIPLLGLLWMASVLLLVFAMRRYAAASRLHPTAKVEPAFTQQRLSEVSSPPQVLFEPAAIGDTGASEPPQPPSLDGPAPALDAVRARVARDRPSAQGLIELVRALYLDGSTFTFNTIGELSDEDRQLASALIDAWLADPSAVDDWRAAYDAVRGFSEVIPSS